MASRRGQKSKGKAKGSNWSINYNSQKKKQGKKQQKKKKNYDESFELAIANDDSGYGVGDIDSKYFEDKDDDKCPQVVQMRRTKKKKQLEIPQAVENSRNDFCNVDVSNQLQYKDWLPIQRRLEKRITELSSKVGSYTYLNQSAQIKKLESAVSRAKNQLQTKTSKIQKLAKQLREVTASKKRILELSNNKIKSEQKRLEDTKKSHKLVVKAHKVVVSKLEKEMELITVDLKMKSALLEGYREENQLCTAKMKSLEEMTSQTSKELKSEKAKNAQLETEFKESERQLDSFKGKRLSALNRKQLNDFEQEVIDLRAAIQSERERRLSCIVCMEVLPLVFFLPCKHFSVCNDCAKLLDSCPNCRTQIREKLQPFTIMF